MRGSLLMAASAALLACSSSDKAAGTTGTGTGGGGVGGSPINPADSFVFTSDEYTVAPGQETYMCYTVPAPEAMNINRFVYQAQPGVHHLVLVTPLVPEQMGSFECDVLFKTTWIPVFANGTGNADLSTPAGAAFQIPSGQQLLLQLHLLNTSTQELKGSVSIEMQKSTAASVIPAGIYGFGTDVLSLPPMQATTITNDCVTGQDLQIFGVFPHMHQLGTALSFWTGPSTSALTKQFSVDTWSFGQQEIYPLTLHVPSGTTTRVSCSYDNVTSSTVGFGELTSDEMCYFVAFIAPYSGLNGCVQL